MRALITGANGFWGADLARELVQNAERVRCLVRRSSDLSQLAGLPVELMYGDVVAPDSLPPAVKECDVGFHLAGIRRAPSPELFWQVDPQGTPHPGPAVARSG